MQVHLTLVSTNKKTGPIPVSTTSQDSCAPNCGLTDVCYAKFGNIKFHWNAVTRGERGMQWDKFCEAISSLPDNKLWRHNQAGDLPHISGLIDRYKLSMLVTANKGKRGFTYTHHDVLENPFNRNAIKNANKLGFTINLSADNLEMADKLYDLNIAPVVTIVNSDQVENIKTPKGRTVVICPATQKDDIYCMTCKLCQMQRDVIVGFPAHGVAKNKANLIFDNGIIYIKSI